VTGATQQVLITQLRARVEELENDLEAVNEEVDLLYHSEIELGLKLERLGPDRKFAFPLAESVHALFHWLQEDRDEETRHIVAETFYTELEDLVSGLLDKPLSPFITFDKWHKKR